MSLWGSIKALFSADASLVTFDGPSIDNVIEYDDVAALMPQPVDWTSPVWKVDRKRAMQTGAVVKARDAICTTIGSLPLYAMDESFVRSMRDLLAQPERGRARSVTMTQLVEDLLFTGHAWWRIVERDADRWPTKVVRLDPASVNVREDSKVYYSRSGTPQGNASEYIPDADLIHFESPKDPLLQSAARAIRTLAKLDTAESNAADAPAPRGIFTPTEGYDPAPVPTEDDPEPDADAAIAEMLTAWKTARQSGNDAYVPASLKYTPLTWSPAELALERQRNSAVLELSRFAGLDPSDLAADTGATGSSMTYANVVEKRRGFIDGPCAGFITAVQDRLSMPDVVPAGTQVRLDVAQYERADMSGRLEEYQLMRQLGLVDTKEILRREELPTPTEDPMPTAQPALPGGKPRLAIAATADEDGVYRFADDDDGLTLGFAADPVTVDVATRTITGLAVPYGPVATKNGRRFTFSKGTISWDSARMPKVLREHNRASAVGRVVELSETDAGLRAVLRIARGAAGDEVLALAEDGVLDGLSVGVTGEFDARAGVHHAKAVRLAEVSMTPFPAFDSARVDSVAASSDDLEVKMGDEPGTETETEPAGVEAVTFSQEQFDKLLGKIGAPGATGPQVVPAVPGGGLQVSQEAIYRFDGSKGEHDFSADLIAWTRGDGEAGQRVNEFLTEAFNVTTGNAQYLNPPANRQDMYVDNLDFLYPIWSAINKGTLADITSFRLPKFNSSSSLVADHAEGVEPSAGAFTTTYQDVTPSAMSGKVVINREVWDQGGSPQLSMLIWREVERAWYEALEKKAVDMLDGLSPTAIALSGVDADLDGQLTDALADLQYIRGGNRFRAMFLQSSLFKALVGAVDDNGRKLFPVLAPSNANGQVDASFSYVNVGGLMGRPAWALESGNGGDGSGYLINPDDCHGWATPPRRIDMPAIAVATVTIGVWGYVATACTRTAGVRELTYS